MSEDTAASAFDVIVVGGSYAGMSAALQLARARRRVLVVDAGRRRNRFADTSHGFLGQDGVAPDVIASVGKAQLLSYPSVTWVEGTARHASRVDDGFEVHLEAGDRHIGKRLILAVGVTDELPPIEGLTERWGRHVFHCPYCHGYELDGGRIGVLGVSAMSMHHALMLPDWGATTLFLNAAFEPTAEDLRALNDRGVVLERSRVVRLSGDATVELADGRHLAMDGLFTLSRTDVASPVAAQLGCAFEEGPMGPFIRNDGVKQTSVEGVFACGDAARMAGSVAFAVGDGALAGVSAHRSLMFGLQG